MPRALALGGLAGLARRNALGIALTERPLALPALPEAFRGYRLLHLSDPHFGADPELDAAIVASVREVEHDLCVMTGDYRYKGFGPIETAVTNTLRLRDALGGEVLAVLGNHDVVAMVPPLEAGGIRVLLNESVTIRRGNATLRVAGVDDTRYHCLHDLDRALADDGGSAHPESSTLLLAHSPEIAEAAAAAGCGAYLCGHTHGGQLCLPGGHPLMRNARASSGRLSGAWRVGAMRGYTSRGVGVSVSVARLFCSPEITLHVLERAAD
mgnify:CR=1 FL=1